MNCPKCGSERQVDGIPEPDVRECPVYTTSSLGEVAAGAMLQWGESRGEPLEDLMQEWEAMPAWMREGYMQVGQAVADLYIVFDGFTSGEPYNHKHSDKYYRSLLAFNRGVKAVLGKCHCEEASCDICSILAPLLKGGATEGERA